MQKILNVSIAIPAHNEASNLPHLLRTILAQDTSGFSLTHIFVISDGSTDDTVALAESAAKIDSRIVVRAFSDRAGKVKRMNEIFAANSADVLVQLDADVLLEPEALKRLIEPFMDDQAVDFVSGFHVPLAPRTFIERLAYFGVMVWQRAVEMTHGDRERYYVTGQNRAFSKRLTEMFHFPAELGSSEDVYAFYWAKSKGLRTAYAPNSIVQFRLASNMKDYVKQMRRFLSVDATVRKYFSKELINSYETMRSGVKFRALIAVSADFPFHVLVAYIVLQLIPRILVNFPREKGIWDISTSSKELK